MSHFRATGSITSPQRTPRLAVVTTHPIQYYAPLFRRISDLGDVVPRVFYGWEGASDGAVRDRGFGTSFEWDVPLLSGYDHVFLDNVSNEPGTHHYNGIDTPELVPAIETWGADAVLVIGWNYKSHLKALRALHGRVPILFRGDSTLIDERGGPVGMVRAAARRAVLRWVYKHVDHALYVGAHNKEYFEAHGLRSDQLSWAPHAVDNDRFSDPAYDEAAARWRRELGISSGERAAVFAGKLELKKAPDVLLRAFLEGASGLDHLVFCGTGPLEGALRAEAAGYPGVHFLGFQNQSRMPAAYRLGDVVVLPSRGPGETWGLAVNEAMASGRPVIVSDRVGCAPNLVRPQTGLVVPAGDPPALARALREVESRAAEMGRRAREEMELWTLDEAASRIGRSAASLSTVEWHRVGQPGL